MKIQLVILSAALILGAGIASAAPTGQGRTAQQANSYENRFASPAAVPAPSMGRMPGPLGPYALQELFRACSPVVDDSGYGYLIGGAYVEERE